MIDRKSPEEISGLFALLTRVRVLLKHVGVQALAWLKQRKKFPGFEHC
jgi:hypothetical protein